MKSSFAITISTTWRRVRPSVLVNWTNNSPNMNASALAASKTSSLDSTFIPPGSSIFKIARAFLAVVFLTTTLAACGSNREIQKDGSGTDEMLKSPCVCVPVDYQAPTYKWVS